MKPIVAVVGRPNVGKSTFINRLVGGRQAIVDDMPGVTRDRQYFDVEWTGHEFIAIDTGGIIPDETDTLLKEVQAQVRIAIEEADIIVFVLDAKAGLTPIDKEIAYELRFTKKPILIAVNKIDNYESNPLINEFYELNLGDIYPISAIHSLGVADLLDDIVKNIPRKDGDKEDETRLKIAIVGKPNVGKSSIVNALLGTSRVIVHDSSGTTRDAIDSLFTYYGKDYTLIDTAGIRKKARVDYGVEKFSVVRSIKAIERADAVLLVIDASMGVTEQDQRIAGMIEDKGKPCVVVINKWDIVTKETNTMHKYLEDLREKLHFIKYAPTLFTSAVTKKRLFDVFDLINGCVEENNRRVTTGLLNQIINDAMAINPPPTDKGRSPRIYYSTQAAVRPPTFILFANNATLFQDNYIRYLENKVRESFGFSGTPIRFMLKNRESKK